MHSPYQKETPEGHIYSTRKKRHLRRIDKKEDTDVSKEMETEITNRNPLGMGVPAFPTEASITVTIGQHGLIKAKVLWGGGGFEFSTHLSL